MNPFMKRRWYQQEATQSTIQFVVDNPGKNPLILIPTGLGKSLVLCDLIIDMMKYWPATQFLMLTHVQELVDQNWKQMLSLWPEAPIGVYSSGLRKRDTLHPIIFASVQSVVKNPKMMGIRHVILIDEAHLISPEQQTSYQKIIRDLRELSPNLVVIGLTATGWRTKEGGLTLIGEEGRVFDSISYDCTTKEHFARFISEGHMVPAITKPTITFLDTSNVGIVRGDFNSQELQRNINKDEITYAALQEALEAGHGRKCCMIFGSGTAHLESISRLLDQLGVNSVVIHSTILPAERKKRLLQFTSGQVSVIIGNKILSTGFNHPPVDMVIDLQPTQSPGLHCLDMETEILTEDGFRHYKDLTLSQKIASINPFSMKAQYVAMDNLFKRKILQGEKMVVLKTPQTDIRVTDQHRMLVERKIISSGPSNGIWRKFCHAEDLLKLHGYRLPVSAIGHCSDIPLSDDELRFIGLYMTDGSMAKDRRITIYQSDRYPSILHRIGQVFDGCNFRLGYSTHKPEGYRNMNRFAVSFTKSRKDPSKTGWQRLENWLSKDFHPNLMSLSERQFDILLEAIHWGDGTKQSPKMDYIKRGYTITTGNKIFAERLQHVAVVNGWRAAIAISYQKSSNHPYFNIKEGNRPLYLIHLKKKQWNTYMRRNDGRNLIKLEEPLENEEVWCVSNINTTIITRRNGKVTILGNCQKYGRSVRPYPGKTDALILDFGGNIARNGPIDAPFIPHQKGSGGGGDMPLKICELCNTYNHTVARFCVNPACGHEFTFQTKLTSTASSENVMVGVIPEIQTFKVDHVGYTKDHKEDRPPYVRVTYVCDQRKFSEVVCVEHGGFATKKAQDWWMQRHSSLPPTTTDGILSMTKELKIPAFIKVHVNKKYPEILSYEY